MINYLVLLSRVAETAAARLACHQQSSHTPETTPLNKGESCAGIVVGHLLNHPVKSA